MGCAERIARAGGLPIDERTAELLAVLAPALGVGVYRSSVDPSAAFPEPRERRALVDALVIVACMPGEVPLPREREVLAIARELGVRSPFVELLPALRKRRTGAVKRALATRSPDARRMFRRIWQEEGIAGVGYVLSFLLGLHRDPELAARFRALADAPPGSYGRAVTEHFASRGLRFPGEKGGLPERMVHHDLMHVLNGYDTDPAGECELGAFYAACADGESFTFFVTVLATFHLGLAVSPAVVMPARGAFDPARAVAAFVRGRRVRVDVMGKWDYWELMPLPLEEARIRLGIATS